MKPHPCGYYGDDRHACLCGQTKVRAYRARVSGPLLDRIDLQVEVPAVPYKDLRQDSGKVSSAEMRARVLAARAVQAARFAGTSLFSNSQLSGRSLSAFCPVGDEEHRFLEAATARLGLSARAYTRILRLGRTIADLDGLERIRVEHLAEAVNYRNLDREYG
ncbi:hypothetical protein JCM15519_16740 [Fundidesulfovibrio butyratiphilus]